MRPSLLAVLLVVATSASAQTADTLAVLDSRIAALDRQLSGIDDELAVVRLTLRTIRVDERALDDERLRFQERIRAYQDEAARQRAEVARVRAMYDDLVRTGGSETERRAYDDARLALAADAARLEDEARFLNEWNADINVGYRTHADRVRATAGTGQTLSQRRSTLLYERETLAARRARLAARRNR